MSKHRKRGRGKDHLWQFVRYKGDIAYYAKCSCGFHYSCYKHESGIFIIVPDPDKLYKYCPCCGAIKKRYCDDVIFIDKYWFE